MSEFVSKTTIKRVLEHRQRKHQKKMVLYKDIKTGRLTRFRFIHREW